MENRMRGSDINRYTRIHYWLKTNFGIADKCKNKDCPGVSNNYQWALLKDKEYEKIKSNFITLCQSCNTKYDFTKKGKKYTEKPNLKRSEETKRKISIAAIKRGNFNIKNLTRRRPLSSDVVSKIKKLKQEGLSAINISKQVGVSVVTVYKYIKE